MSTPPHHTHREVHFQATMEMTCTLNSVQLSSEKCHPNSQPVSPSLVLHDEEAATVLNKTLQQDSRSL